MKKLICLAALISMAVAGTAGAQAVPEGSQADRLDLSYRRSPSFRFDPFRDVMVRHWGFKISGSAIAANNTLNLDDIGAIIFLADRDSLGFGEAIDISGLVPTGSGLTGFGEGLGRVHIGGPLGSKLAVGFSAGATGFGAFQIDDRAVSLFRDGNGQQEEFTLGETGGAGLAVAQYGVHATLRLDPIGGEDGAVVTLGAGGRVIKPLFYASGGSLLTDGGRIVITNASRPVPNITGQIQFQGFSTPDIPGGSASDYLNRGSGFATDLLARIEWPTSGFAAEIMVANVGTVDISGVERRETNINVTGSNFNEVFDQLQEEVIDAFGNTVKNDTVGFDVQDTVDVSITLPKIIRFTASAWANRILQIDVAATAPVTGEFETPLSVDLGTTWRFSRVIPIRFGVLLGGDQGVGFTGGIGIESRHFLLQFQGGSLGGFMNRAKGAGGQFEFGFFF